MGIVFAVFLIGVLSILGSFSYMQNLSGIPPVRQLPSAAGSFRGYAHALQEFATNNPGYSGQVTISQLQTYANPYTTTPLQVISGNPSPIVGGICGGYEYLYTEPYTQPILQYIYKSDQYDCAYGLSGVYNGVNGVSTPCGVVTTPTCVSIPSGSITYLTSVN